MIRSIAAASVLAAGLALAAPQAHAQAANDAVAVAEAKKVLTATKTLELMQQIVPQQVTAITNLVAKANPGHEAIIRQIIEEIFVPDFMASLPAYLDEVAVLYTKHYSLDELRQLNAFYEGPLGKKVIDTTPLITQQSIVMGQAWGGKIARGALEKAAPKLRERGITL